MAILRDARTSRSWVLESECLIGRSTVCSIQLEDAYVSSQHASVRWTGDVWEVRDLGSANGTRVDGTILAAGQARPLRRGARAGFGSAEAHWELVDDAPPAVMAVEVGGTRVACLEDEIVGVPSNEAPIATIYRAGDGRWRLERPDGSAVEIAHGQAFEADGHQWRFSSPHAVSPTETSDGRPPLSAAALEFRMSRDEEYVELTVELGGRRIDMGSRAHNALLVNLARHLVEDRAARLPESACGWVYVDDLADELGTSPGQINIDIFRARRQFGTLGLLDPSEIVQRRARTRQLRLGAPRVKVNAL